MKLVYTIQIDIPTEPRLSARKLIADFEQQIKDCSTAPALTLSPAEGAPVARTDAGGAE
jgi:hypothetical protein